MEKLRSLDEDLIQFDSVADAQVDSFANRGEEIHCKLRQSVFAKVLNDLQGDSTYHERAHDGENIQQCFAVIGCRRSVVYSPRPASADEHNANANSRNQVHKKTIDNLGPIGTVVHSYLQFGTLNSGDVYGVGRKFD